MALTLVVEDGTGLANANTFANQATALAILEATPFASAWTGVASGTKDQCLAEASAWLSRQMWDGVATTETQALAFPRTWLQTPDGYTIASDTVPTFVLQATARLAFWLSQQAASPFADTGLAPGTELELPGGLRLTPSSSTSMPPDIRAYIAPYVRGRSALERV